MEGSGQCNTTGRRGGVVVQGVGVGVVGEGGGGVSGERRGGLCGRGGEGLVRGWPVQHHR